MSNVEIHKPSQARDVSPPAVVVETPVVVVVVVDVVVVVGHPEGCTRQRAAIAYEFLRRRVQKPKVPS